MWDRVVMVDWSGGADRGAQPKADAIWLCSAQGGQAGAPEYLRNRVLAQDRISALIEDARRAGERILIGFDFPFGYPAGVAELWTGTPDPFAIWADLTARIGDLRDGRDRWGVAGAVNAALPGDGPFWFKPASVDADVPSKKPAEFAVGQWREAERRTKGAFSCWQLGGAGAVGSQVLMGVPVLAGLRAQYGAKVWPFEALDGDVGFVEIWPSLIGAEVAKAQGPDEFKDAAQVRVLAQAVSRLSPAELSAMLADVPDVARAEEGWILGLGHEETLAAAARQGRLQNDCFALPPGVDWAPVDAALDLLRARLTCVVGSEEIAPQQGRILARDVVATRAHPPAANSAVDGYGLGGGLVAGVHHIPLIEGRAAAGAPYAGRLPEGHAIRVLTGAALPEGVTTVVLEEDVRVSDTAVHVEGPLKAGANARAAGEDVTEGATVLRAGRTLTPADLALCAATGAAHVHARKRLRFASPI
ncbi:MAG: hypothetical protein AAFO93_09390 [Pseudomonadota bacterium]